MSGNGTVLFVTGDYPPMPGGLARFLGAIFSYKPAIIVAPEAPGDALTAARYPAERVPVPLGPSLAEKTLKIAMLTLRTMNLCRTHRPRVLCAGQATAGAVAAWLAARAFGIPYVVITVSGDLLSWRYGAGLLRAILGGADAVVAISRFSEARLLESAKVRRSAIVNPPLSLDLSAGRRDRGLFGINDDAIVVLTVARLVARKGVEQVIDALAPLMKKEPRLVYAVAGSGPEREALQARAQAAGIADRVKFLGFVGDDRLPSLYLSSDIFILPAFSDRRDAEGFGIVYVEAQAAGLPVIASSEGGAPETVDPEESGLLVKPQDVAQIRGALQRLVDDSALRKWMGEKGKAWVAARFNAEIQGRKFWDLLESIHG